MHDDIQSPQTSKERAMSHEVMAAFSRLSVRPEARALGEERTYAKRQ